MIDAAKVYCPPVYAPSVARVAEEQGLTAIVEGSEVLIIPSLDAPEYKPGGQIPEVQIAQAAKEGTASTNPNNFDITAFACENLTEVEANFESAGIPVWDGTFGANYSGMVSIDTNY